MFAQDEITSTGTIVLPSNLLHGAHNLRQFGACCNGVETNPLSIEPGLFRDQRAIQFIWLHGNSMKELPPDLLVGLNTLQKLMIGMCVTPPPPPPPPLIFCRRRPF